METRFSPEQLADPATARANEILRTCVHCGFCIATCPTYQVLGDELDSPRGRIYLIKDMLENQRPADAQTVKHIDRCLSCLACMTTCPSDVHYMHLVDHAREYIENTYNRPVYERLLRTTIAAVLTSPKIFRLGMIMGRLAKPFVDLVPEKRLQAMVRLIPSQWPAAPIGARTFLALGKRKYRVVLFTGCVQQAINPAIHEATVRLLTRLGCDVVVLREQCCGALTHHMGKSAATHKTALKTIRAFKREIEAANIDAIIINTSGCGTTIKDYGYMFRSGACSEEAKTVSRLAVDLTEFLTEIGFPELPSRNIRVGYHAACSLQHGQGVKTAPKDLLAKAGFEVLEPVDSHLCCGSAGTYNMLQPEIASELRTRKVSTLKVLQPDVIAAGNIGCMMQIGQGTDIPILHTAQLLDWAMEPDASRELPR